MFGPFIIFVVVVSAHSKPTNNTVFIHSYAKVANFGASSNSSVSEGRSSSGQTLWTHRSDANVITGQNLNGKDKPLVVYYSISKNGDDKNEMLPAKGEIQERFNPPPYFDYDKPAKTKPDPKPPAPKPSATYGPPFDTFPVFQNQQESAPSDDGLYSSPYSSYNPPAKPTNNDDDNTMYNFPPVQQPQNDKPDNYDDSPPDNSYLPPPSPKTSPAPSQDAPDSDHKPPMDDFHGPYAYSSPHEGDAKPKHPMYMPPDDIADAPPGDHPGDHYYPEPAPPAKDSYLDHPPPSYANQIQPPMDEGHSYKEHRPSMAEDDLSPPPPKGNHIPDYLDHDPKEHGYDFGGFDHDHDHHHVYHEVTTTTEAPQDERVNKGQYSYYYLGRKLWYVPLYFSIYFIIYVTILILKSIARHKIQYKHEHFHDKYRKSREMEVDDVHREVSRGVETAEKKYMFM